MDEIELHLSMIPPCYMQVYANFYDKSLPTILLFDPAWYRSPTHRWLLYTPQWISSSLNKLVNNSVATWERTLMLLLMFNLRSHNTDISEEFAKALHGRQGFILSKHTGAIFISPQQGELEAVFYL